MNSIIEIARVIRVTKENGDSTWIVEYSNGVRYTTDYTEVTSFIHNAAETEITEGEFRTIYTEYK